jgi:hypothetical protein
MDIPLEVAMQAHADALPLALERAGESRRNSRSRGQSKTAVLSAKSTSAQSGPMPVRLTILEGCWSWRALGSHSTSSPPSP